MKEINNCNQQVLKISDHMLKALAACMFMVSVNSYANQTLIDLDVTQPSVAVTQLQLNFDDSPVTPEAFLQQNPARLVLDFNNVENGIESRFNEINKGLITNVTTLSDDTTTRIVIGLTDSTIDEVGTVVEGNTLLVNIAGLNSPIINNQMSEANQALGTSVSDAQPPQDYQLPSTGLNQHNGYIKHTQQSEANVNSNTMTVQVNPLLNPALATGYSQSYRYEGLANLTYNGNSDGGGTINLGLVNDTVPVDIQRQGNKIVVRITGASVPQHLVRQQKVTGGLVSSIVSRNNGKNGLITIAMNNDFEYQAYQSGNQVGITIKPPELLRPPSFEDKQYTGEPLSLDIQNVDVRSVLHLLSQFTKMNIVASDSVSGSLTIYLENVPWDQALDIILKSKNLAMRTNGNVIIVAPATEIAQQEASELEALQKLNDFLPLRTEYIRLNYAKAEDVQNLIFAGSNTSSNLDSSSLLSKRGTVSIDTRTNTLIIKDTANSIETIRGLLSKIDIPVRQVMIEARIVSATDNFSKELGVKWGILSTDADRDILVGGTDNTLSDLKDLNNNDVRVSENLNVDLGLDRVAGSIAFGLLAMSDVMIDLELSAMQADGRGEVISAPKVLTMDKQTAKVSSGTQIPYQEASASGATTTSFKEAALSLEATPNITPEGKIALELSIENGRPVTVNGVTAIETDSLTTNVIVEDGQTVVLGGIYRDQSSTGVEKVPFLGDVPVAGRLFRKDVKNNSKQELLIFVTPKLLTDGITRYN